MEVEMVETIDADYLSEILKQAIAGEEIILKSNDSEDNDNADIEEIIEIIEEVEEDEDILELEKHAAENNSTSNTNCLKNDDNVSAEDKDEHKCTVNDSTRETVPSSRQEKQAGSEIVKIQVEKSLDNGTCNANVRQIVSYDVEEDWVDEDLEQEQNARVSHNVCLTDLITSTDIKMEKKYRSFDSIKRAAHNQNVASKLQSNKSAFENIESSTNVGKFNSVLEYEHNSKGVRNVENNSSQHEIVKNVENNLVYTVLESKKQEDSTKQNQEDKHVAARYIKMEQLEESTIPVEGTIYYEGDDMETLYVAHSVNDNEQYQYGGVVVGQEEQDWEAANQDANQEQDDQSQDQIFLHEDEEGQLYFKDENGILQPVYLTPDGNYAIAENNSDDQDSQESQIQSMQNSRSSETEAFIVPDLELSTTLPNKQTALVPTSNNHEVDNEDNTVTISLIISEDEHGQKRTQVIIPTPDNLKCDICNKTFKTSFQLLRHNRLKHAREEDITTRNFPCDLCSKRYPDQNSLARHRKTHTGERPFQCLECQKTYSTSIALRRHLTLHNPQSRPLPCIYCGRRFLEKSSLAKHEQSHIAGDHRNHTCDICHKSFLHASDLNLHKKNHDPDKKFDCEVCGREFNRLNNLQRHMMVHQQQGANEEILSCDVCGITYKFMSSLTRHMVTTHMNPEKLRQQAEEQRRKRENNYRRYLENRKMFESQHSSGYSSKRGYHHNSTRIIVDNDDEIA